MENVLILTADSREMERELSRSSFQIPLNRYALLLVLLVAACLAVLGLSWNRSVGHPVLRLPLVFSDQTFAPPGLGIEPDAGNVIPPDQARNINAAIPISSLPLIPASRFKFSGDDQSLDRARDCLASALWYEAGDDPVGQRSVAQVVLNRVMHPAFPKTVCGVVYQGSERATGCQFTFACDGSMRQRLPSDAAWARARANAEMALAGFVDPTVGLATHYHTDWVVPRWSSALIKIAKVGTHLFFRFPGQWGQLAAFRPSSGGVEPQVSELARLSPAHGGLNGAPSALSIFVGDASADAAGTDRASNRELMGNRVAASDPGGRQFALQLNLDAAWASFAKVARQLCGGKDHCTVMGWAPDKAPSDMAGFRARRASALFVYRKSGAMAEQALWDCRQFLRPSLQCLPGTAAEKLDSATVAIAEGSVPATAGARAGHGSPDHVTSTP